MNELRLAVRGLLANRRSGLLAIITLALGLGGCMIVYSLLHDVFLKPLPFTQPDKLVRVWERNEERNWHAVSAAPANFIDWRERSQSFSDMAAYSAWPNSVVLTGVNEPRMLKTGRVSGNVFDVLGVQPALGRAMTWEETWQESAPVVMLSDALWRTLFDADPHVVGSGMVLDGETFEIIGVMPPSFFIGPRDNQLWVPYRWPRAAATADWFRRAHFIDVVGRLQEGMGAKDAEADLRRIAAQLRTEYPQLNKAMDNGLTPLHEAFSSQIAGSMNLLFAAVLMVLLIACINVSGLLLARGISRRHLYSVQAALGATRARLLRGPLGESLLISAAGGLLGLAMAYAGLRVITRLWPAAATFGVDTVMDMPVLVATVVLTTLCTLLTGLLPALRASRALPVEALMQAGRSVVGRRGAADLRRWLLGLQLAGTILLLAIALAAVGGFQRMLQQDPGFATEQRAAFRLVLPQTSYASSDARIRAQQQLLEQLRIQGGIRAAAMASNLPIEDIGWSSDAAIEGRDREDYLVEVRHREVSPNFFEVMRIPMLRGASFASNPAPDTTLQAVVNRTFAERYFPGESPLGKRVTYDRYASEGSRWRTIVGVVDDFRQTSLHEPVQPEIYDSLWQPDDGNVTVVVHSALDRQELRDRVQDVLHALDPGLPLQEVTPLHAFIDESTARARLVASILGVFGIVAVLLSGVGLYAAVMFEVDSRWREIGLRQALGADRRRLFAWLAREWRSVLALSLLAGLVPGAAAAGRINQWLGEIGGSYSVALLLSGTFVLLLTLATGWSGGRRAAAVEPVEALRAE